MSGDDSLSALRASANGQSLSPAGADAELRIAGDTGMVFTARAAGIYVVRERGATVGGTVVFAGPSPSSQLANLSLSSLRISPRTADLAPGGSIQFIASHAWDEGQQGPPSITWDVADGGTISPEWVAVGGSWTLSGRFSAGTSPGTYRVMAHYGALADTVFVTVGGGDVAVEASTGLSEVNSYGLASLAVSPSTVTIPSGGTTELVADYRWNGATERGAPTLTWTTTGGSIRSGWVFRDGRWLPAAFYQPGAQGGVQRVVASYGSLADTATVTVGGGAASAPVLTAVEVAPGTASVGAGGTQPFTATGRLSDGSTASVAVTWTATGGTIGSGGLYTAGATAGTYRVIAQQQGGSLADTAAVTVTVAAPPPTSGGTVDPTLLPAATGQAAASAAAYTALPYYSASGTQLGTNPRTMPVGAYYLDPTTGVKVVRLTSPTAPFAASGAWMSGVDYAEGGLRIGRPAGSRYLIPVVPMGSGGGQGFRLLSFDLSSYAVGVSMATAPGGTNEIARAMSYTSPGVMYTINGGILRKWDVSGASAVEIVSGPFPKDLRAYLHGQSSFTWFQGSTDDRWFAMMAGYSGPWLVGFDAQTNTVTEKSVSGIDEPKMDRDGRYVWARGSTPYVWDMQANTLAQVGGSQPAYDGHGGVTRGYAFGNPNDGRPGWSINLRSTSPTYQYLGNAFNLDNMYLQGGWADQAAGGTTSQWVSVAYQTGGSGEPGPVKYRYGALGLYRLDGSEHRLLAHAYNSGNVNGTQAYYANAIWPNFSPDGRFLIFKSNQLVTDGFSSLFAAILPSR
jgi:hypothetical protein